MVRSDCGTENGVIAATQCFFRANATDPYTGQKSHVYGSSHANQHIEGWWSFLRRHRTSWWIDFFKDMVASNVLVLGNNFHMQCLWFCFFFNSGTMEQSLHPTFMTRYSGRDS